MSNIYRHKFYKDRHQKTVYSANKILPIVMDVLPEIHSVVDFGCGVGTWLSVLKEKNVNHIQGLDGFWVKQELLEIPKENFRQVNLEKKVKLSRRYDLAISLEVAEHLPIEAAGYFVESLVNASDFVLFSAAIPFQGGKGHINEQWPDYWARLFKDKDYIPLDIIREKIWNDEAMPIWYRQNILLFLKQERMQGLKISERGRRSVSPPISMVHPGTYLSKALKVNQAATVKGSLRFLRRAVKMRIKNTIKRNNRQ